ncbi:beta-mannosidase [Pseudobacteroides cellulosolvens]|uniref:Beta-mannosidase B n=1 Tax=Pseudobacteroides cellulosolvens ATCC 35603 = DSM 2933 TaxID=398512 RepID=A0A0L6JM87_9FIRM|nr:glycoside hydrolase family 2 protein [Pseudobacteroides cellulosolvens]KNY26868.1 Beta-mannosidase [Pseudobacteroides cellulosolvens ATCC 35603 = DSM 2933]
MKLMDLNGKWMMKRVDEPQWIEAKVPGSVYSDLLSAGKIEDPFYRENEDSVYKLSCFDYEYSREFTVTKSILEYDFLKLKCEGLDTIAEISVNGKKIAETENMHRSYEFDIKKILAEGVNTINILFKSPVTYLEERKKVKPIWSNFSDTSFAYLRKAHYMFGWDWSPALPDMGIWRSIYIEGFNKQRIDEVYVTQKHEQGNVTLDIRLKLDLDDGMDYGISLTVCSPQGDKIEKSITMYKREEHVLIEIPDPLLWWPNGCGEQNLYNIEVVLSKGENRLDSKSLRIGLRTMTINQKDDEWGRSFAYEINGIEIFAKGANFVPMDNILARCSRERTERLIKSCVDANFNSIRVWGGAYYPEDYFFDLCDEYGLIVWQDLMFACGVYDFFGKFKEEVIAEVVCNMKRIRHHASLGLWCGNNEMEQGWSEWDMKESEERKQYYIDQFEVVLPQVAKDTDPNTFYWLASPSSFGGFDRPNDENYGDMHDWTVWHSREPFSYYRKRFPRFMSEFGLQSFPCRKTIESFTLPEDRNIFSYIMEKHQKCGTGNEKIMYYISQNFRYPNSFDSLLYLSQLVQTEGIRYGVEHWRRNRGRCMGAIYWQLNDCWPVASWASIDSFGRWKALHYAAKRFYSRVLASACEDGTSVSLHITNDTLNKVNGTMKWRLIYALTENVLMHNLREGIVEPLTAVEFEKLDFSKVLDTDDKKRNAYLDFKLTEGDKVLSSGIVLFVPAKYFNFKDPEIEVNIKEEPDRFVIGLTSKKLAKYIELNLKITDGVFSDNYFDMSGGEIREVYLNKDSLTRNISLQELKLELTIRSLYDSYEKA